MLPKNVNICGQTPEKVDGSATVAELLVTVNAIGVGVGVMVGPPAGGLVGVMVGALVGNVSFLVGVGVVVSVGVGVASVKGLGVGLGTTFETRDLPI